MPTCGSSFSERTETRGRWRWKSATSPTSLSASRWTHSASRISSAWEISPKYASGTTTQVSRPDVPSLCLVGWLNQLFLTVMLKSLSHCLFDLDETWKLTALLSNANNCHVTVWLWDNLKGWHSILLIGLKGCCITLGCVLFTSCLVCFQVLHQDGT